MFSAYLQAELVMESNAGTRTHTIAANHSKYIWQNVMIAANWKTQMIQINSFMALKILGFQLKQTYPTLEST